MPIQFTPCIERGYHAMRFGGRLGVEAIFKGVVTNLASPTVPSWNQILAFLKQMAELREIAGSAA